MFLIPLGARADGTNLKPVATTGLIFINIAWFILLYISPFGTSWKVEAESARRDLEEFWTAHPNLTPPESLARLLGPEEMAVLLEDVRAGVRVNEPGMSWLDEINKRELDRRSRRLEEALEERPVERFGFVPAHPNALRLITSMFTHGGVIHLGGNMLVLWATGPFVEASLGPGLFVMFYLAGGLAATLSHALVTGGSTTPVVGASGAIAAVMGTLLVRNGAAKIRFLFLPIFWIPRLRFVFGLPAFVVLPFWFAQQIASTSLEPDAPTAWWAHIGGFVFGMAAGAMGLLVGKRSTALPSAGHASRSLSTQIRESRSVPHGSGAPVRSSSSLRVSRDTPERVVEPRSDGRGRASIRVALVNPGSPGEIVITQDACSVLRQQFGASKPGAVVLDEVVSVTDGPAELNIQLRLIGAPPRATSVVALLKNGETRLLRIERLGSRIAANLE